MNRYVVLGYVFLVASVLLWAGNSTIGRASAGADIPPIALNFWRWTVALPFFLLLGGRALWAQRADYLTHWKYVVAFSLVSVAGFNSVFYIGLQNTLALQCVLIQAVLPVLVLLLCLVFLRQRITGKQWWGVVFSIGGATLIIARGDMGVLAGLRLGAGDLWCLGAVFIWALQAYMMRWKPRQMHILPFMAAITIVSLVAMFPFYVWETVTIRPMPVSEASVMSILYVGIFASVAGTTMWNEGTYRVGGATAGYFGNLFPIFAGLLAIVFLGEVPAWYHGAGAAAVLLGIYLATMARRETEAPATPGRGA